MDEVRDLDARAEAEGRRLLTAAFETVPGGEGPPGYGPAGHGAAGADLLRGVRRRMSRGRRIRTLVPVGAATAACGGVTASILLTTTVTAVTAVPSAFSQVASAAAKTTAESFVVTMTQRQLTPLTAAARSTPIRVFGRFDTRRGLGLESVSGGEELEFRFIAGHEYVLGSGLGHGKPWAEGLAPSAVPSVRVAGAIATGFTEGQPIDPGALLGLLRSAASIGAKTPASGPGWTGTKYAFTVRLPKGEPVTMVGSVSVDSQGRVRQLVTYSTLRLPPPHAKFKGPATIMDDLTFSGFGIRVFVTAPPAGQVDNLGQNSLGIGV